MSYRGRELTSGNYLKLDDIQSQFNGSTTTFNLTSGGTAFYPGSAFSLLVSLAGVVQEVISAYTINQNTITFASAPQASDDFFCVVLGTALGIGVPGEGTVSGSKLTEPFDYDDGMLYLDSASDRVGINSTAPRSSLDVRGNVIVAGVVTATTFSGSFTGALTGTATSTTNIPNLTGAITSSNTTTSLGSFTSANLLTALTDETGSGAAVFATSPTLVTPVLGAASATSIVVSSGSTFTNGPILVGTATSTGTASQPLQVTGGAYVSGSLGVGVTNPGANANGTLQVNGTIGLAPNSQIRQWTNADSGTLQIFATQVVASTNNSGSGGYTDGATIAAVTNSDGSLLLDIGRGFTSSTRFRIGNTSASNCYMQLGSTLYADTGSGNLGVGVVSPLTKLDSRGTILVATNANGNNLLAFGNSTSFGPLNGAPDGSHGNSFIIGNSSTASGAPSYLSFWTTSNGTVGERARIQSTGEVSIGTTTTTGTASQLLQVTGGAYVSGSVGIGTANPQGSLDVHADQNTSTILYVRNPNSGSSARTRIIASSDSGAGSIAMGQHSSNYAGASNQGWLWTSGASTPLVLGTVGTERVRVTTGGNVGIATTNPQYTLHVVGSFAATTKSFVIDHPTKPNYKLRYASLEGEENGVYVRGRTTENIIELPEYWTELVDKNSITVNLTPIGNKHIWIEEINNNKVYIDSDSSIDCFYTVFAERKDVEKLIVEIEEN